MTEKWFKRAIVAGFQGLVTLRLDGAPPADAVAMTLDIWLVALTKNRQWDEQEDAERIRQTFESLFASCERWPSPARFLRDLKPRKQPLMLPRPERSQAQVERGQASLKDIVDALKGRVRAQTVTSLKTGTQIEYTRQQAGRVATKLQGTEPMNMEQQQ
ncbi:hypothetical protein I5S84_09955 [Pseudomonas putida]|uniref:Uncharacterized protein n=1 Tax=Pseudomonas putida TaxID=303 RepID=A0A6I6XM73_PSEPU|nr:hypothetical protein [Pseudomonas putida]MBH3449170.1 hypothetical protein [Pseudomonas putida]QHG66797.1 hypothetical protein C2H86_21295 [Pseudomonas putida]